MLLKFWAFVYRHTGYFSNYARLKEYEYIREVVLKNLPSYYDLQQDDLTIENWVDINIGLWQARHGFYRSMRR